MSISIVAIIASFFSVAQPADTRVDLGVFSGHAATGQVCTTVDTDADLDAYDKATQRAWASAEEAATYVGCKNLTAVGPTAKHSRAASKNGPNCVESFEARFQCKVEPLVVTLHR